jgi:hypothetical protein
MPAPAPAAAADGLKINPVPVTSGVAVNNSTFDDKNPLDAVFLIYLRNFERSILKTHKVRPHSTALHRSVSRFQSKQNDEYVLAPCLIFIDYKPNYF